MSFPTKNNTALSKALRLWVIVVLLVLSVLWLETRKMSHNSYNLFLSGDSELVGAEVYIDNVFGGIMSDSSKTGLGGALYYGKMSDGHHKVEVKKHGFESFVKEIDMHGKDYINVDLKP